MSGLSRRRGAGSDGGGRNRRRDAPARRAGACPTSDTAVVHAQADRDSLVLRQHAARRPLRGGEAHRLQSVELLERERVGGAGEARAHLRAWRTASARSRRASIVPTMHDKLVADARGDDPAGGGGRRARTSSCSAATAPACRTARASPTASPGLKRLAPLAEHHGVTLCLELLNSKVDHKDYQADHTAWGVQVVQGVGSPRLKLLYDIYHMQIMEGDVIADHSRQCAAHRALPHRRRAGPATRSTTRRS